MLQYCHDISNIKQYDDNTVNTIPLLSCSCGHTPNQIPQSLEINQMHGCNARVKTHTERPNLQSVFPLLLEHTVVEGWFTSIRSILPKPMVFGHPKAVRHHCVNIGSVPILLSSFQAEQKGSTTVSEHQNA